MLGVINIVFPVFGLGLVGYCAARWAHFGPSAIQGLNQFIFNFAAPCMIVRLFAGADLPEVFPWLLFLSYFGPLLLVYALIYGAIARRAAYSASERAMFSLAGIFGNTLLIGYPLIQLTLGPDALVVYFVVISVHSLVCVTLTTCIVELTESAQSAKHLRALPRTLLYSVSKNPIVMSLLVGIALNLLAIRIPEPIDRLIEYLAQSLIPCSLFAVGASLMQFGIRSNVCLPALLATCKNLLMPLAVWSAASFVFHLPPLWVLTVTMMAALPIGVTPYVIAGRYNIGMPTVTTSILLSNLGSVVSLSLLIYAIQSGWL